MVFGVAGENLRLAVGVNDFDGVAAASFAATVTIIDEAGTAVVSAAAMTAGAAGDAYYDWAVPELAAGRYIAVPYATIDAEVVIGHPIPIQIGLLAQVINIDQSVTDLSETVTNLDESVTNLAETVTNLDQSMTDLSETVNTINETTNETNTTVENTYSSVLNLQQDITNLGEVVTNKGDEILNDLSTHVSGPLQLVVNNITQLSNVLSSIVHNYFPAALGPQTPRGPLIAACLDDLAHRALVLYPKEGINIGMLHLYALDTWQQFVHQVGAVYEREVEIAVPAGTAAITLPSDFKRLRPHAPSRWYAPRSILSLARADGVLTVTTTTAHALLAGCQVAVAGTGDATVDGTVTVLSAADSTSFSAAQAGADVTLAAGRVTAPGADAAQERALQLLTDEAATCSPTWRTAQGPVTGYWWRDAQHLGLSPSSDGSAPMLVLRYEGEIPENLHLLERLPVPHYLEMGLVYGIIRHAAARPPADEGWLQLAHAEFERAIDQWRRDVVQRKKGG